MNPLTNTFYAGLFYLLAGMFGLIQHFLLEPSAPNYPKAPPWLLHVFFAFAAVLIFAGLRFLTDWGTGEGATVPPGASGMGVLMAFSIFVYKGAKLANVLRQWYPAEVWARLDRLAEIARCPRR